MERRYGSITRYCPQWDETKARFAAWWDCRQAEGVSRRPMIRLRGLRAEREAGSGSTTAASAAGSGSTAVSPSASGLTAAPTTTDPFVLHGDTDFAEARMRHELARAVYLAEAFPNTNINLGAGSLALYLGSRPEFRMETVWFHPSVADWGSHPPLSIDPDNRWWKLHLELIERQVEASAGEYLVNIPDLVENLDILAAVRGPERLCIDLVDFPDAVRAQNERVQDAWDVAYDGFYERTREVDGSSSFTAFQIWGPGRTAKVQCDFNAMIGPDHFREFVQPQLRRQCDRLDYSLFHLDGPDALRHADALMEIESLNCLQWTPGDGNPDGGGERWYPLYDTVRAAGKGLHIGIHEGSPDAIWNKADALVRRYGSEGLYLLLPDMPEQTARAWLERAEREWGGR